jgi:hypothetical protein
MPSNISVRAGYKDSRAEDLKKAIHYLTNELETTTGQRISGKVSR